MMEHMHQTQVIVKFQVGISKGVVVTKTSNMFTVENMSIVLVGKSSGGSSSTCKEEIDHYMRRTTNTISLTFSKMSQIPTPYR